jgi:hypothetical protein
LTAAWLRGEVDVDDPDQPDEAFDELDRRRLESGGPADIIQIVQARRRSIRVGDPTLLRTVLDDSFVDGGHRPLGMGSRSVDDDVASITMLTEHGGRIYLPKIAAYTTTNSSTRTRIPDQRLRIERMFVTIRTWQTAPTLQSP